MAKSPRLQAEYYQLLDAYNVRLSDPIDPEGPRAKSFLDKVRRTAPAEDFDLVSKLIREKSVRGQLQQVIDEHASEVEAAIRQAGLTLETDVFVGEFPTGAFNAQARLATDGALLLMNTGLMMFLHESAKIMSWAVATAEFDERGQPKKDSIKHQSGFSRDQIVTAFAQLVAAYLTQGNVMAAGPSQIVFDGRERLGALVTRGAQKFVLAHEYGHVIAGHLSSPRMMVATSPAGDIELVAKSWDQELEADRIGFRLALGVPLVIDSDKKLLQAQLSVAGVMWFFALDELITHTVTQLTGQVPALCDHPPSRVRMDMFRNGVRENERKLLFGLADQLVGWSGSIRNEVGEQVGISILRRRD